MTKKGPIRVIGASGEDKANSAAFSLPTIELDGRANASYRKLAYDDDR
jgi:hypothetical protein